MSLKLVNYDRSIVKFIQVYATQFGRRWRFAFGALVVSMVVACSDQTVSLSPNDRILICRAAIAKVMNQPIGIITGSNADSGLVRTSYQRPGDRTVWRNICRFSGNRVVWASIRDDGSLGRWRDHALDSVVSFQLSNGAVLIEEAYSDGSSNRTQF